MVSRAPGILEGHVAAQTDVEPVQIAAMQHDGRTLDVRKCIGGIEAVRGRDQSIRFDRINGEPHQFSESVCVFVIRPTE